MPLLYIYYASTATNPVLTAEIEVSNDDLHFYWPMQPQGGGRMDKSYEQGAIL